MAETLAERMRRLGGGGGARVESLADRLRRLRGEEDEERPSGGYGALSEAGRGLGLGLAESGYGLAQGAAWLGNVLTPGQPLAGVERWAQEGKEEAREFYRPQGAAGTVGRLTGRVLGEGAVTIASGLGVARGVVGAARGTGAVARTARPLAQAIEAGRRGNFAQRVAANVAPALPLDVAFGAGAAEEGQSRVRSAAINVAFDLGGASLLEGVATALRAGGRAYRRGTDFGEGMFDDLGFEGLDDLGRVPETPIRDPRRLLAAPTGPAIPMPGEVDRGGPVFQSLQRQVTEPVVAPRPSANRQAVLDFERTLEEASARRASGGDRRPMRDILRETSGHVYANPVGPSLRHVAGSPATSAAVGATAGALADEENRVRGAAVGAAVGLTGSYLFRRASSVGKALRTVGDPDVDRVLGTIATGRRAKAPSGDLLTHAEKAYAAVVDELYPLRKLGREAGGSDALSNLATQASGWRSAAYQRIRDELKPVIAATEPVRGEVMALAKAQRALTLLDQGLEKTDIPRDVLERTVAKLSRKADVKQGADALQAYYRRLLEMKYQNGVIAPEVYQAIVASGDFYTPFTREFDEAARGGTAGGGRLVNRGTGVRRMDAKQARAKTVDPYEQAILDTFETQRTVAKQRVTNMVAELVETDPAGTYPFLRRVANRAEARAGRVVEANVQGERRYYEVVDEDLFNAWASFDPKTQNLAVRVMAPFKRMLQTGVTMLPDFALANAIRDNAMTAVQYRPNRIAQLGGATAGAAVGAARAEEGKRGEGALIGAALGLGAGSIAPNIARTLGAMRHIVKDDAVYKEFLREGGPSMNGFYPKNTDDARRLLEELERTGVKASDIVSPRRWWEALQYIGRLAEQSPRLAQFEAVRKAGGSAAQAVAGAADISLDFSKVGSHTKGIAAVTAFWNAKVQGWDKLARLLKNPKTWGAAATTITAPSVALWAINRDNDEYWERPQWERNLFWLVPKDGSGFWRIPKPFEVGFIFGSIPERLLDFAHERDWETLAHSLGDMLGNTFEGTVPLPTLPSTIAENVANFDFFRRRPIVSRTDLPNELQADERTSSVALLAGRATGVSPQKIDNTLQDLTGGAGRIATSLADRIARATGADPRPLPPGAAKVPVLGDLGRRFQTQDGTTSDAEQAVWRRYADAEKAYRGALELRRHGTPDEYRAHLRRYANDLRAYEDLRDVTNKLREVRSARREVARRRDLTAAERERALRKLTDLAHGFATRGVEAGNLARRP